jgi:hypothetical protein
MNDHYAAGFVDKCAEYGVDPEQLVKYAAFQPSLFSKPTKAIGMLKGVKGKLKPGVAAPNLAGIQESLELAQTNLDDLVAAGVAKTAPEMVAARKGLLRAVTQARQARDVVAGRRVPGIRGAISRHPVATAGGAGLLGGFLGGRMTGGEYSEEDVMAMLQGGYGGQNAPRAYNVGTASRYQGR